MARASLYQQHPWSLSTRSVLSKSFEADAAGNGLQAEGQDGNNRSFRSPNARLQVTLPQLQTRAAGRWDRGQINRNDENEKKTRPLGYMDHDFGFAVVDVRQSYLQPAHRSPVERFSR